MSGRGQLADIAVSSEIDTELLAGKAGKKNQKGTLNAKRSLVPFLNPHNSLQAVIDDARHNLVFFRSLSHWYGEVGSNCSILGKEKIGVQEGGWCAACANATVCNL